MRWLYTFAISVVLLAACLPDLHVTEQGAGGGDANGDTSVGGSTSGGTGGSSAGGSAATDAAGGTTDAAAAGGTSAADADDGDASTDPCLGKDCLGASCSAGLCQPVTLSEVDLRFGYGIAVTATDVYFGNGEPPALYRCPLTGCGAGESARVAIVPGEKTYDLVARQGYLYWSGSTFVGAVKRGTLPDCANPQTLTPQLMTQVRRITVTDTEFYFGDNSTASSCPLSGCTPMSSYGSSPPFLLFRVLPAAGWVFWSTNLGVIWRASAADATKKEVVAPDASNEAFAVDATHIYLAHSSPDWEIYRCPLTGCDPDAGAGLISQASGYVSALIVDDTRVYWAELGMSLSATGRVLSAPINGGPPTVIAKAQAVPTAFAQDAKSLYWLNSGLTAKPGVGGSVMRWAK